ncbi:MAG: DUF3078 domain-containing protein [Bacteroidaceae bacterium]|nr:DUF3078 domain-containing protein [Bacteroidaceae bacterium]
MKKTIITVLTVLFSAGMNASLTQETDSLTTAPGLTAEVLQTASGLSAEAFESGSGLTAEAIGTGSGLTADAIETVPELETEADSDGDDLSDNPIYYRLFMPLTLYNGILSGKELGNETYEATELNGDELLNRQISQALLNAYLTNPELIDHTEDDLQEASGPVTIDNNNRVGVSLDITPEIKVNNKAETPDLITYKPRYWKHPGKASVKFTQNKISDNWYKGGESNQSLLVQLQQDMNYAKEKFTFDNKLEAKLGYYTTTVNDEKTFKTNDDLFRITSKVGLKAFKYWSYTTQLQAYTQFMDVRDKNGNLKSLFLAPGYANIAVGLDYKPKFKKNTTTLSLVLAPLTFNSRYVSIDRLAPNYGIEEGKNFMYTIGSSIDANWKLSILEDIKWTGKARYFTNFEYVETNWENTFDYSFNKYFSIQLFIQWRFDDSAKKKDEKLGYHQYKEFLTFNFNYSW